jgi:hypothetical protein
VLFRSLFAVQPTNDRCRIHRGVQDLLFSRLRDGGPEMETLLERWTIDRDRSSVYCRR